MVWFWHYKLSSSILDYFFLQRWLLVFVLFGNLLNPLTWFVVYRSRPLLGDDLKGRFRNWLIATVIVTLALWLVFHEFTIVTVGFGALISSSALLPGSGETDEQRRRSEMRTKAAEDRDRREGD